jgi:peptidoglycan/xylan/chitin deacetylase (PgdA/CDA1 family)
MPATAFVITGRISNGDVSFLTWGYLRLLEKHGIAIGSHTVHHLDLRTLSDADVMAELRGSRRLLERRLGHEVRWLAYPAGAHDGRVVALARRAGYLLAVTTEPGAVHDSAHPLELRRFEILDSTGVAGLASFVDPRR